MTEHGAPDPPGATSPSEPVRVHLTGFEAFAGAEVNASWLAVQHLPEALDLPGGPTLLTRELLPVTFVDAPAASRRTIIETGPDILVHVGVDDTARAVRLETAAANWAQACLPDNSGHRARGEELVPGAPTRLHATWHAAALVGRLTAAGHCVERSEDAGRYVCNATFYAALDAGRLLERKGRHAPVTGFVHVPPPHVLDTEQVRTALVALVGELAEQVRRRRAALRGTGRLSVARSRRVLRVGLTGGIGSGKSTVARLLASHGAHVVDADAAAREVVEPGTPGLAEVRRVFGPEVMSQDGSLDRAALASVVFGDARQRERLEAIVLPLVAERSAWLMEQAGPGAVAVYDVPLLVEQGMADLFDCVVVVEAPLEERLARLAERGMNRSQALERTAHQASDAERRAVADIVVRNDASPQELADAVDRLWLRLSGA